MKQNHCIKCEHNWTSRVDKPAVCPRCKTYYWKEPKNITKKEVNTKCHH